MSSVPTTSQYDQTASPKEGTSEEGIVIEMGIDNDLCINATHLTVKCDNNFLVTNNSEYGQQVAAQSGSATVAGQKSCIVLQQPSVPCKRRKLPIRKCAQGLVVMVAAKAACRIFQWHCVRHRCEKGLAQASVPSIIALLSNPHTAQATLVHLAHDLQTSSNLRLRCASTQPFPAVSDMELSRASTAANCAQSPGSSMLPEPTLQQGRPTSCLSISSVETTPSSDEQDSCLLQPQSTNVPLSVSHGETVVSTGDINAAAVPSLSADAISTPLKAEETAPLSPQTKVVGGSTADVICSDGGMSNTQKSSSLGRRLSCGRDVVWPQGEPVGGRALALLTEQPALWDTFVALVKRLLCSEALKPQRDAAWAVQVVAFASERLCQRLVNAGIVKLLLSALSDSYGLRIRSGGPSCRLRQPGAIPPCLPGAATLLSHSPLNFPTLHIDLSRSMVTLSPHGVNFGFLKMLPQFGRAVQRNLSPRCRNTASKRQAAAEALQNVCALRSGARDLLSVEHGLDVLCSAVYTQTLIGRVAVTEAAYSCMLHFPRSRSNVYNTGFDHALKHALDTARAGAAVEVFMRTYTKLSADRGALAADSIECTMFV